MFWKTFWSVLKTFIGWLLAVGLSVGLCATIVFFIASAIYMAVKGNGMDYQTAMTQLWQIIFSLKK